MERCHGELRATGIKASGVGLWPAEKGMPSPQPVHPASRSSPTLAPPVVEPLLLSGERGVQKSYNHFLPISYL